MDFNELFGNIDLTATAEDMTANAFYGDHRGLKRHMLRKHLSHIDPNNIDGYGKRELMNTHVVAHTGGSDHDH